MQKKFTWIIFSTLLSLLVHHTQAQTIAQWNFNSAVADNSTATGITTPSVGSGTIATIGGPAASFASGAANGGSSDPATTDNTGWGLTGWPAQGTNNKTAGIQLAVSLVSYQNIIVSFDHRHSNTAPRHAQFQYTTDVTASTPLWVDFAIDGATGGDAWFARSYNLTSVSALNNNPNAAFRIVAAFDPAATGYAASNTGSNYATGGTWRFDMVTVAGTSMGADVTPPVAQSFQVTSPTTSFVKFSEMVTAVSATNPSNYVFSPSLTVSAALLSASGDTVFLTHAPLVNGQPYVISVTNLQDAALNTMVATNFNRVFNASLPQLVITEIIHSPNDIEMIEVFNAGNGAVNLGGLKWTNGTTGNFPEVTLAAGSTALFATSPTTAATILGVTPVYTILNGLGSSDDILVIRNSLNQVVDSVAYFVGINNWPAAPVGVYGYSFELNNAGADNNAGTNWAVPQNLVTPQPAQGIVRATPGVYPAPAFTPTQATVNFVGTKTTVGETTATVNITANIQGGGSLPSSIDIEVLPISTATGGADYILPASMTYNWVANANNVNAVISITINNDALPENAEYFIVRFTNPVNVSMPPAASNHFTVVITDNDKQAPTANQSIVLNHIASFSNGAAGSNSAEIVAHDPTTQRLFIANSIGGKIDIVNFSNPAAATVISSISMATYGGINSIAVKNGIVAAAIENAVPELPGKVVFFDVNGAFISQVTVGAMPDMITFTKAGTKVLTANEGQPSSDYTVDPEGSVSIIDISGGVAGITQAAVTTAGFGAFNAQAVALKASGVRIFGLNATVAQDMEPEYISLSADDQTAYVTCQENNAIAVINLTTGTVTAIRPLGTKDYSAIANALDISDQGGVVEIANWPVRGVYMPDAIASYVVGGQAYYVTANEGDQREYNAFNEGLRVSSAAYVLDPVKFPYADALKANIGRLNITTASGDTDNDGGFDERHAYGGRSISIWNATTGALVWDSGSELELIISKHPVFGAIFNASNSNNTLKNRSDDKGPEPEGIVVTEIAGRIYAFVALERIGGCLVYDITDPASPLFVDYKNTRTVATYGGDNGSEGIIYIDAANSPTGIGIVVLANEVSSTLSFYSVSGSVLDISLGTVTARNIGTRNQVHWNSLDEAAGDVYEVEKSSNGTAFSFLASVAAKGVPSSYNIVDEKPFIGKTFYRLKLINNSGKLSYSPIVSAVMESTNILVKVYPNPVKDRLVIVAGNSMLNTSVDIVTVSGIVLKTVQLITPQTTIDLRAIPAGVYTLRYREGKTIRSVKVIKE